MLRCHVVLNCCCEQQWLGCVTMFELLLRAAETCGVTMFELLLRAAETCGVTMFELLLRAAVALRCVRRLGRAGWLSSDATFRKSVLNQCAAPYNVVV